VSFIDCSGLRALCRARNRVLARSGRLRLVTDSARLLGMLRSVDLGEAFEVLSRPPKHAAPGRRPRRLAERAAG